MELEETSKEIETGKQSLITETVIHTAEKIPGKDTEVIENISKYIQSLKSIETTQPNFSRTAEEIIKSGKQRGCHEAGLVFTTILRSKGYTVSYIQAFLRKDLTDYIPRGSSNIRGHVFLRQKVGNEERIIDSISGEIIDEIPEEYIIGGEGLDSWDIGLKNGLNDYVSLFEKIKEEKQL